MLPDRVSNPVGWLVVFGFNGPLRQYFSLYRAVSQREGERGERIDESKNVQTTPTRTYCKRNRPLPYCYQNCRTPRHWKFTQHHRTTQPSPIEPRTPDLRVRCPTDYATRPGQKEISVAISVSLREVTTTLSNYQELIQSNLTSHLNITSPSHKLWQRH